MRCRFTVQSHCLAVLYRLPGPDVTDLAQRKCAQLPPAPVQQTDPLLQNRVRRDSNTRSDRVRRKSRGTCRGSSDEYATKSHLEDFRIYARIQILSKLYRSVILKS